MSKTNEQQFYMQSMNLYYVDYGNKAGTYRGSIKFKNKKGDEFVLSLDDKRSMEYLNLIREDIISTADELGKNIAKILKN